MAFSFNNWDYVGRYDMTELGHTYTYTATVNTGNGNIIIANQDDLYEYLVEVDKDNNITFTLQNTKIAVTGHWIGVMCMSEDGTKLYTYSVMDKTLRQHNLSTAYDISTLSQVWYDSTNYTSNDTMVRGIYVIGTTVAYLNLWDDIKRYTITSGNLSSLSYHSSKDGPVYRAALLHPDSDTLLSIGGNVPTAYDKVTGISNLSTSTMTSGNTLPNSATCNSHASLSDEFLILGDNSSKVLTIFKPKEIPPMVACAPVDKTKFIPYIINT